MRRKGLATLFAQRHHADKHVPIKSEQRVIFSRSYFCRVFFQVVSWEKIPLICALIEHDPPYFVNIFG